MQEKAGPGDPKQEMRNPFGNYGQSESATPPTESDSQAQNEDMRTT